MVMSRTKNNNTMKTLLKIFISETACFFFLMGCHSFGNQTLEQVPSLEITITPGEKAVAGTSMHNPIVLKKAKNYHAGKEMQENYIRQQYGNYQIIGNGLTINSSGHFVQSYMLKNNEDGKIIHIYFDINDVCKKYKTLKDKDLKKRIENLLKSGTTGKIHEVKLSQEELQDLLSTPSPVK